MLHVFKYTPLVIGLGQGMTYIAGESKVVYKSKDGKEERIFDTPVSSTGQAFEWIAAMSNDRTGHPESTEETGPD